RRGEVARRRILAHARVASFRAYEGQPRDVPHLVQPRVRRQRGDLHGQPGQRGEREERIEGDTLIFHAPLISSDTIAKTTEVAVAPINPSDTAWLLVATALVLMMTPALGFFYGGMVRAKNALNTLMMSFAALGFVGLGWAFFGYSWAFGSGGQYF